MREMEMRKGKDSSQGKKKKSKTNLEELLRTCENIALYYLEESNAKNESIRESGLYKLLIEMSQKGANLIEITQEFPKPLKIDDPNNENPFILKHIHFPKNEEELTFSKEWPKVLESHHDRRKKFTKKQQALQSAADTLFRRFELINENLYCSDITARDLNLEIIIKQKEIQCLIKSYLEFIASELSVSSYQSYDTKYYLKTDLKPITEKSKIWNGKILFLVNKLKSVGYKKRQAFITTYNFLYYIYPHIFSKLDENFGADRIRQRYTYHTSKMKK
jgi:hypothetical protein